jgi:hypothetical protein
MDLFDKTKNELIEEIKYLSSLLSFDKPPTKSHEISPAELKYRITLEKVGLIAISIDKSGVITYCNEAFIQFTGWNKEKVEGANLLDLFSKENQSNEDSEIEFNQFFTIDAANKKIKRKIYALDGSLKHIKFHIINEYAGKDFEEITLVGEDITEKKRVIKALRESNEHLYDLFENANDLIQVFAIDGKLLFVNNAWKNTLGYSDEDIVRLTFDEIIHPDFKDQTLETLAQILEGIHDDKIETVFLTKDKKSVNVIGSINIRFEQNKPVALRGIFHDATERIRAEKAQNLYYKISSLTINSDNLEDLLQNIHQELKSMIAVNNFHVALHDVEHQMLVFPYYVDETLPHVITTNKRKISKGLTEYSLFSNKPTMLYEEDILELAHQNIIELMGPVPKVWLGVPLKLENRTIGVIAVKSHSDRNKYKLRHLELLDFISGQIATAIERKRNEEKIIEQTARLEAIFQSSSHLIWSINRGYALTNFNQNYAEAIFKKYGKYPTIDPLADASEKMMLSDKKYHDYVLSAYQEAFKGVPQHFETSFTAQEGHVMWRETYLNPIFLPNGVIEEVSGISHDITEKKNSELAIQESEEKFRSIFESFQDIYYRTDLFGKITMISPSGCNLSGYSQDEIIGNHITKFYVNQKKQAILIRELLKTGSVRNFENNLQLKNGEIIQTISNIRLIYNKDGKAVAVEGVARDITYLLEAQDQILKAKEFAEHSLKIKESFLANMSHEIRTPMNGIIGMIDLLIDTNMNEQQMKFVQTIKKSSETLLTILNDILDLSKIEAGKMQLKLTSINFEQTIEKVYSLFFQQANTKNISLEFEIDEQIPRYLVADEIRLIQIISNLTSNAIKFTEKGGVKIKVNLENKHGDTAKVKIRVIDSGIGISEADLNKLFESFSQLDNSSSKSYAGTGLGLAISKELCRMMNGQIGVESQQGQGSTFWFTFEARESKRGGEKIVEGIENFKLSAELSSPQVLLVDDNQVNQMVASEILKKIGCQVSIASNGLDAIESVKSHHYDIIFMDIQMPKMDGIAATAEIRKLNIPNLAPIIAMTAYSMQDDKEKFLNNGMDDYISKPITLEGIANKVKHWISKKTLQATEVTAELGNVTIPQNQLLADVIEDKTPEPQELEDMVINMDVLNKLKSFAQGNMLDQIYQEFVEETEEQIITCKNAIEHNDWPMVKSILHTLKGTSGTLGIAHVEKISKHMEANIKNNQVENLSDDFEKLSKAFYYFKVQYPKILNN